MAEAFSENNLTQQDKDNLKKQIRSNPEVQSAVEAISSALDSSTQQMKYSPATGKRYSSHLSVDPETGVPLKWVED